ncbi:hypothetical protein FHR20_001225 [Sphingomonas leidyi]|uniref:DUF4175 domain-containing protein n=1 Tax=Sphingomonas leidyi TaxID=68569 RepID=A0A7X5UXV8_9SPHN|nr:hypothetical protein [Sphingomonas leidyi]NIJ64294.1 hypothetical protein [Sphingomonas leidyi]
MAILLVLGMIAGLYMLAMLFTLAVYALPLYAGLSAGFWAQSAGYGVLASVGIGFGAAILTWVIGQFLFATIRSPALRVALALLFAIPAGLAGYHAVHGVAGLALDPGTIRTTLAWIGAFVIGVSAWLRLASVGPAARRAVPQADRAPTITAQAQS